MHVATFRCQPPSGEELVARVARQAGYPSAGAASQKVLEEIREVTRWGTERVRPEGLYRIHPLSDCRDGRVRAGDLQVQSAQWARLAGELPEPRVLAGFVVTLGGELEDRIRRDQDRSLFRAYLLDAAGSVLAEWAAERMEGHIAGLLGDQGLEATGRFSPGYCDWEVLQGQRSIFAWLRPESLGVRCTGSGMMVPRKSISACMLGAFRVARRTPCATCSRGDCPYRREGARGCVPTGAA